MTEETSRTVGGWERAPGPSSETRALLACARAVLDTALTGRAHAALAECDDEVRLSEAAAAHGMVGHLNRLVTSSRAESNGGLRGRISGMQRSLAERNLRQTAQLLRLLGRLEGAGIVAVPYKGPAWAERFYGDLTMRAWSDLDVFVTHAQVAEARALLLANGFSDHGTFNERIMAKKSRGWGEIALWATAGDVQLELHWEATVGVGARSLRAEAIMAGAKKLTLLGREVMTPSDVDALLLTCLNGTKDHWAGIEGLLCVALQVQRFPAADWPLVLAGAKKARCLRRTLIAVAHTCRVFDLETPPQVAAAVARDGAARRLLRGLTPANLERGKVASHEPRLDILAWRFASEDSFVAALLYAATRFLRPGPEDWEWLALPKGAGWLYPVLRPARLAAKWAKRLVVH